MPLLQALGTSTIPTIIFGMPSHLLKRRAQSLRGSQTDAEQRLWHHLRAHRFFNLKFRRQHPVGPYIVDFVCLEQHLVIELDGGQHVDQAEYDLRRTTFLAQQGLTVLRFWDNEVLQHTEQVLEKIRLTCVGDGHHHSPRPLAGEG